MILFCKPRQKSVSRCVIFFKYRFSTPSLLDFSGSFLALMRLRFMFLTEEEVSAKLHDFNERSFPLACYASSGHQLSPLAS